LWFNPFVVTKNFKILFLSWTSNTTAILNDKIYFNKRDDYYLSLFENETISIEKSVNGVFRQPRFPKYHYNRDLIHFLSKIFYYLNPVNNSDEIEIKNFINYLKINFPYHLSDNYYINIEKELRKLSLMLRSKIFFYKILFKRINPKIVFVQNASYGPQAYLIKLLKDLNIKSAEFQHGTITKGHLAYNYADKIIEENFFKNYHPDYLLMFGKYWMSQTNTDSKKLIIGSPHLSTKISGVKNIKNKKNQNIIIISQGSMTDVFVKLAIDLAKKVKKNYKIIFKLHPAEIGFNERYKPLFEYENINISSNEDIYDVFAKGDFFLGCYSTVIFESLIYNKPIFILKNEISDIYIPDDIGFRIKSADDIIMHLNSNNYNIRANYYWDLNWKKNYKKFINKITNE
tara:strand:+ start:192 stop:1394 length:1203 start_codon:yes stop_codon:yes gene_type:complete